MSQFVKDSSPNQRADQQRCHVITIKIDLFNAKKVRENMELCGTENYVGCDLSEIRADR